MVHGVKETGKSNIIGSNEVPKREENVRKSDLQDIHVHVQMISIKKQGVLNLFIINVTIMAAQNTKWHHGK